MKAALYARVSKTTDQTPENQLLELRKWATNTGAEIVGEFVDELSSRDTRPQKEEIKRRAVIGEIDTIVFVALDRWGRNITELVGEMQYFSEHGVKLISLKEGLNFDTAAGKMYANLLAVFANFERERIRERTLAGLARVRAQGRHLGRPKGSKNKNPPKKKTSHDKQAGNAYINDGLGKPGVISTPEPTPQ